jgi:hypothetical protein
MKNKFSLFYFILKLITFEIKIRSFKYNLFQYFIKVSFGLNIL